LLESEHEGRLDHLWIEHVALDRAQHSEIHALLRHGQGVGADR
jgi:hypothetical protein